MVSKMGIADAMKRKMSDRLLSRQEAVVSRSAMCKVGFVRVDEVDEKWLCRSFWGG